MKKLLPLFILILAVSVIGQTKPCDLTLKDVPTLRGLKLGMTIDEVNKLLQINMSLADEQTQFVDIGRDEQNQASVNFKSADIGEKTFATSRFKSPNFEGVKKLALSF